MDLFQLGFIISDMIKTSLADIILGILQLLVNGGDLLTSSFSTKIFPVGDMISLQLLCPEYLIVDVGTMGLRYQELTQELGTYWNHFYTK